jgi:hypothetical protein
MTEEQWHSTTDLQAMLEFLKEQARPRKFRLFACACLRQLHDRTDDLHFRRTVALAERYVEGDCDRESFRTAFRRAWPNGWERARIGALTAIDPLERDLYHWRCLELANEVVDLLSRGVRKGWYSAPTDRKSKPSRIDQVALLREVFGDPFRPAVFAPQWRTGDVVTLAESIAREGTFEDLPVLADALEEAGCSETEVLTHLRRGGRHVLGCWALDLVRGRR